MACSVSMMILLLGGRKKQSSGLSVSLMALLEGGKRQLIAHCVPRLGLLGWR